MGVIDLRYKRTFVLCHLFEQKISMLESMLELKLELKLGLELKVGFLVDQTPIRVIFEVGLKVPNIDPNAHRKAIEQV